MNPKLDAIINKRKTAKKPKKIDATFFHVTILPTCCHHPNTFLNKYETDKLRVEENRIYYKCWACGKENLMATIQSAKDNL